MKLITKTELCFYCKHPIDLSSESYDRIDTLQSVLKKKERSYAHELCTAQADEEADRDNAISDWMDEQQNQRFEMAYVDQLYGEDY